ncbi:MAG TPA: hypothetical protein VK184_24095 [Nostocaceae cyanobacterium]|nr:hypothetical protein [Nostocaceae cyanobacterium]
MYSALSQVQLKDDEFLLLVPLPRLDISEVLTINDVTFYPKFTVDIDELYRNIVHINNDQEKLLKDKINSYVLGCFKAKKSEIEKKYTLLSIEYDAKIVDLAIKKLEPILDIFRFYYCDYFYSNSLPGRVGQIYNSKSVVLIFEPPLFCRCAIQNKYSTEIVIGNGLKVRDLSKIKNHNNNIGGEVYNIIKYALRLNSQILEQDNLTVKFIQIMTLFEFLGFPYQYQKFEEVKKKIASHIGTNKQEYEFLKNRFYELTKPQGYRTEIVHNGKEISDFFIDYIGIESLFVELQYYISKVISELHSVSNISWNDLEEQRRNRMERINRNNSGSNNLKFNFSRALAIINLEYLVKKLFDVIEFYNKDNFNIGSILQSIIENLRFNDKGTVIPIYMYLPSNYPELIDESYKEIKLSLYREILNLDSKRINIMNSRVIEMHVSKIEKNKSFSEYFKSLLKEYCQDGNRFFNEKSGYNIVGIFADDKMTSDVIQEAIVEGFNVNFTLIREFNYTTQMPPHIKYVASDYVMALAIGVEIDEL